MSVHRCSTCASIASLREYTCITRVWVASNECDVHSFAAHCLRFCLFTAAHAARPSLQYICASISSLRGCTRVDGFGFRGEAQLVKITGQTNNMQKTVLVQNEVLEWGTPCFPRRAFRLKSRTKTIHKQYKNRTCSPINLEIMYCFPRLVLNRRTSYTICYSTMRVSPKLSE